MAQPRALVVEETGALVTVQDLGRPGLAPLGVPGSGAADRRSHALANRLVGNQVALATLEVTLGGVGLRAHGACTIALAGAIAPVSVDGRAAGTHAPLHVRDGELVRLGVPPAGLRTYVAVRGGFDVPPVLGSRSTDTLAGLGPPALRPGDRLPVGAADGGLPGVDVVPGLDLSATPMLRVTLGPRDDWFTEQSVATLLEQTFTVSPQCNRVGIRLSGPRLARRSDAELKSEGMVTGSLQVPVDGHPILFLADHPVTGGYPVVAVVDDDGVDRAAQLRPGDRVRFGLRA